MKRLIIVFVLIIVLLFSSCEIIVPQYTPTPQPTFTPTPVPTPTIEGIETPTVEPTEAPTATSVISTQEPEGDLSDISHLNPLLVEISHYMIDDNNYKEGDGFHDAVDLDYVASSTYLEPQAGNTYECENLYDFDLDTVWCEGADDYGVGEWALYYVKAQDYAPNAKITDIEIINGYIKTDDLFNDNSMPKEILVLVNEENWCILNLSKNKKIQQFDIPDINLSVSEAIGVRFVILDAYEGEKYKDTCITAIEFCGTGIY